MGPVPSVAAGGGLHGPTRNDGADAGQAPAPHEAGVLAGGGAAGGVEGALLLRSVRQEARAAGLSPGPLFRWTPDWETISR